MTDHDREYLMKVYEMMSTGRVHQARWMLSQLLGILDNEFGPINPTEPERA